MVNHTKSCVGESNIIKRYWCLWCDKYDIKQIQYTYSRHIINVHAYTHICISNQLISCHIKLWFYTLNSAYPDATKCTFAKEYEEYLWNIYDESQKVGINKYVSGGFTASLNLYIFQLLSTLIWYKIPFTEPSKWMGRNTEQGISRNPVHKHSWMVIWTGHNRVNASYFISI